MGAGADLTSKAMEAFLKRSEGTFLWISLAIEIVTYFGTGYDVEIILHKLPVGLEEVYREMLETLSLQEGSRVLGIVWSVAPALRPFTFSELSYIIARAEQKAGAEQPYHRRTSGEIWGSIDEEIKMYVQLSSGFLRAAKTTVSIIHHTTRKYLLDERSQLELTISWECIQYLHHAFRARVDRSRASSPELDCEAGEQGENQGEVARKYLFETAAKWPYLRYAAESWFIHAHRSIQVSKDEFYDKSTHNWLWYQFFKTSDVIRKPWIELCGDLRIEALEGEQTPLHITVCLGFTPLVEKAFLLFNESERMKNQRSQLHLAAKFISGAYKILIPRGGRWLLTDPDQDCNTPLHQAVILGHSSMLKDLVEWFAKSSGCGKEINKKDHSGNTPLHLAFQFDHPEIVKFLVKRGADITIKKDAQLTASELGEKLKKEDSLHIVKRAGEIAEGAGEIRVDTGEIGGT